MGFLSSMLPTIAGAGLMVASGGTINPMTAGLILGGLQTARTGSLQKGMMAGLGAYGGAGLAGGLVGAGTAAAEQGALNQSAAESARLGMSQAPFDTAAQEAVANTSNADLMSKGVSSLGQPGGFTNLSNTMAASGGPSLGRAGLAAALPAMVQTTQQPEIKSDSDMGQRYSYSPGRPKDSQGRAVTPAPDVPGYDDLGRDFGRQQSYFDQRYTPIDSDRAKSLYGYANGGPVEEMSTANAVGANTGYPMADIGQSGYATPFQAPVSQNVVAGAQDVAVDPYTGQEQRTVPAPTARFADGGYTYDPKTQTFSGGPSAQESAPQGGGVISRAASQVLEQAGLGATPQAKGYTFDPKTQRFVGAGTDANYLGGGQWGMDSAEQAAADAAAAAAAPSGYANGGAAKGGLSAASSHLGDYSDGGRLLKGPGDGVSDSIPAVIGKKRPARLADGEFVVPARIVSELGNGSTEAGARKLYAMLDRVQAARKKSIGKGKVAKNSRADKLLPA